MPSSPVKLVEMDVGTAYEARNIVRRARIAGFTLRSIDAIHLATALLAQVTEIHTYEPVKLPRLATMMGIKIVKPHTDLIIFSGDETKDE